MHIFNKTFKIIIFSILFLFSCSLFSYASASASGYSLTHSMMMLMFQLSLIIMFARIGGNLAEKIKLPRVLGEIISGMLIGPYLLGGIALPGFEQGVFAIASGNFPISHELYGFTTVAAIVLLFIVGLETDLDTFINYSMAGSGVGIGGVAVSFVFGNFATIFCAKHIFGTVFHFGSPIPLFMGVISTATSVGISARILSENKKLDSPEGVTILSGAVIDDVLGIIILAIVLGVVKSGHVEWTSIAFIGIKAIFIWLGFTALGLYFSRHIGLFLKSFKDKTTISVMSLALAFILGGIFEKAGLAMIIGSYVMGLSLSKTDLAYLLQEKLSVIQQFFVPIFFCVTGMLVNFHEIMSWKMIIFGLVFVVFGILGKLIGCGIPALFLNFNFRGALRIGLGMTPRGEVTMIIAGVGLSSGILEHDYFGVVIVMTFMTTLLTPPIFSRLLKSNKPALRKAKESKNEHEEISFEMPNAETADFIFTKSLEAFENEGFYIHRMHGANLYQIRKDQTFITMELIEDKLVFGCLVKDIAFIHTLFYEVIAELEHVMKNIHALSYKDQIGKKIFDQNKGDDGRKNTARTHLKITSSSAVSVDIKSSKKEDIIAELVDLLIASGQLNKKDRDQAIKDLLEREESMSTGMQGGIALPHARTKVVSKLLFAIGVKKEGVDFDSLDGQPSTIFILTLAPKTAGQSHLLFLAEISKFFKNKNNSLKLLACDNNNSLFLKLQDMLA